MLNLSVPAAFIGTTKLQNDLRPIYAEKMMVQRENGVPENVAKPLEPGTKYRHIRMQTSRIELYRPTPQTMCHRNVKIVQ